MKAKTIILGLAQRGLPMLVLPFYKTRISAPFSGLPLKLMEHLYLKGLKQEIRAQLALMNPSGLVMNKDTPLKVDTHHHALWHAMKSPTAPESGQSLTQSVLAMQKRPTDILECCLHS